MWWGMGMGYGVWVIVIGSRLSGGVCGIHVCLESITAWAWC